MEFRDFDYLDILLAALVAVTGLIHLYVGITTSFHQLTLAGAGFIGGLALFIIGYRTREVVLLSLPFTGYQIYAYYVYYGFNGSTIAAVDKAVQILILVLGTVYLIDRGYFENLKSKAFYGQ